MFSYDMTGTDLMGLAIAWVMIFSVFTALSWLANGKEAFNWDKPLRASARINWLFILANAALTPLAILVIGPVREMYMSLGLPRISPQVWAGLPPIVPALVALLWLDFLTYWTHRIRHRKWLWPIHSVHHSDPHLNHTSFYRAHILEATFTPIAQILFATWLGTTIESVGWLVFLAALQQMYVHCRLDWDHGPFNLVFASPRFHHWHHADVPEAWDKNFSNILPLWDRLFGTYYCPGPCNVPTGFEGNPGESFVKLFLYPFRLWGEMLLPRRGKPAEASAE